MYKQDRRLKKRLEKYDETLVFNNYEWCDEACVDCPIELKVYFIDNSTGIPNWAQGYKIDLNGDEVYSSKTLKATTDQVDKLIVEYNLKQIK